MKEALEKCRELCTMQIWSFIVKRHQVWHWIS